MVPIYDHLIVIFFLLLGSRNSKCSDVCPGATLATTTAFTPNCDTCTYMFNDEWNTYVLSGYQVCSLDAYAATDCFVQAGCEHLFFMLIDMTGASFYLLNNSNVDTTEWQSMQDVTDTYDQLCPNGTQSTQDAADPSSEITVAYFVNLDTAIAVFDNVSSGSTIYTLQTNNDAAAGTFGIWFDTESNQFELNRLQLLVKRKLTGGENHTIEFFMDYQQSCGPGTLLVSVLHSPETSTTLATNTVTLSDGTVSSQVASNVTATMTSVPAKAASNRKGFFDSSTNVALVSSGLGLIGLAAAGVATCQYITKKKKSGRDRNKK